MTANGAPTSLDDAILRLDAAEDALRAIRAGEVDAFVVSDHQDRPKVFGIMQIDRPYEMFVEHMHEGAATVSDEGVILYVNDRLAELLACPKERVVGAKLETFLAGHPGGGTSGTVELELVGAAGTVVPVLVGTSPLDLGGEHLRCITFTDLTARRAQEAEIARLHQVQVDDGLRFRAVVEALQEGVVVQDGDGHVLVTNCTASAILGLAVEELETDPPTALWWGEDDDAPGRRALASGRPVLGALISVQRGDERIWLEINSVPLRLPGEVEALVVISSFRDVTARIAAEEAIRFQAVLLDTAGQAIVAVGGDGRVLYWNKHAEQMYGWSAEEAVGRAIVDLLVPTPLVDAAEQFSARVTTGQTWGSDHWVKRRDGTLFPVFATSTPVLDDAGGLVALITVATDITERKRAEERTRRLSAIVESSSDAIIGMSLERVITSWNPGAVALFGYEAEEAIGQNVSMLASPTVPDHVLSGADPAEGLPLTNVEVQCITRRRELVNISLSVSPIVDESGQEVGLSGIARSTADRIALEHRAAESRKRFEVEQHKAELAAIGREEADRASRAKSQFLSRMSHELRTPLNAMLGFGQILEMDDLSTDQRENVGYICTAGEHLLGLINDVLDISSIEAGALHLSPERVRLDEVVAGAIALIQPQATESNIAVPALSGGDGDVYVQADRQRLLQVLLNLLSNAVKYNRPDGRVDITCTSSNHTVTVAVTDTGTGMSQADLDKLFTPFERLGANGTGVEGTGIGLALARVLSHEMGGSLTVTSTLGVGSTFTLELPVGDVADASVPTEPEGDLNTPAADLDLVTVLAIEDNVTNIRLLERIMEHCPTAVLLTAVRGGLGLELAAQHHPDIILLDLNLPDLSGEEVLQRLQDDPMTASIPVVICSGDASPDQREARLAAGAAAYLTKPFDLDELYELIEQARRGDALVPRPHGSG